MGQVILDLQEYDQLKKQADAVAQLKECFKLRKDYDGQRIALNISTEKTAEIFKKMYLESEYNDGSYELVIENGNYDIDIADWCVKAVKKEEPKQNDEETGEDKE